MRRKFVPFVVLPLVLLAAPSPAQSGSRADVTCLVGSGPQSRARVEPRSCTFVARGTDPAVASNRLATESLRWKDWGARAVDGSGLVTSPAGDLERATVRLSGRISCGGGRHYTRVRVTYRDDDLQRKYQPSPLKLQACAG
jgi:hypothetical protein